MGFVDRIACLPTKLITALLLSLFVHARPQPSALSVPIRPNWHGNDGFWSAASVRVGTPPQWVELFVSTASQETWVVGPGGCDGTQKCLDERGGIFMYNESSTWNNQGTYYLGLDAQLNFTGKGTYGLDSIAFGDQLSIKSQIISVINTTDYWLGFFGLGVKPTNITGPDLKPFISSLVEKSSLIPSHSYGYTAGAHHRLKGVPGSLTLGGTDTDRYRRDHDVSFALDPDQNPSLAINRITAKAAPLPTSNSTLDWVALSKDLLLPGQADLFTIDSSTPFMWLPEPVCLQFEKALNLTYDNDLQLYIFGNDSDQRQNLIGWNISFEFVIADLPSSSNTLTFTLPYAAFDLQLSYPYNGSGLKQHDPDINYFPLRKAANSTQYTIGRSFLQETYLIVDYERNNFSLYPAKFLIDPLNNMNIVDIARPHNSTWAGPQVLNSTSLSKGGIAGISVAVTLVLCFLVGLFLIYKTRRRRSRKEYVKETEEEVLSRMSLNSKRKLVDWLLHGSHGQPSLENLHKDHRVPELHGKATSSPDSPHGSELDGSNPTLHGFYEKDEKGPKTPFTAVNAIGHDPLKPVELPYRASNYKSSRKLSAVQENEPNPEPYFRSELPSPSGSHGLLEGRVPGKFNAVCSPSDEVSSLETIARRAAWYVSNESPSVSSESRGDSHGGSRKSARGPLSVDGRTWFPTRHSRQNTVSSLDLTITPGMPSRANTTKVQGSPSSYTKVPRNSRATSARIRTESESGESSGDSSVTDVIRRSVRRGFSWLQPRTEEGSETRTVQATTAVPDHSPYSPARWIEFWKTGRDPRLGPVDEKKSPLSQ